MAVFKAARRFPRPAFLAWAIKAERTARQMPGSPFHHPLIEDGVRTAPRAARGAMAASTSAHHPCLDGRTAA